MFIRPFIFGPLVGLALSVPVAAIAAPNELSKVKVDVVEESQPIKDVLERLQQRHGLNYVVSERVLVQAGVVTVKLKQVPLDAALEAICSACDLSLEFRGPILVILPKQSRSLPRVREGLRPRESRRAPARRNGSALPSRRPEKKSKAFVAPVDPPSTRRSAPPVGVESMAIGEVIEVDMPNRRLQLKSEGVKRDFYLPAHGGPDPKLQGARLGQAVSGLKAGYRVALLYRYEDDRPTITNLVGGSRLGSSTDVYKHRRPRRKAGPRRRKPSKRPVVTAKKDPRLAPESKAVPEGVLVGKFVKRVGEVVQVRRADGKVIDCHLPPKGDERREKALKVFGNLEAGAKVFLITEVDKQGRVLVRDPGIAEVKKKR